MSTAGIEIIDRRCVGAHRDALRVLHVVNGEHYAGAERVQDLLAARLEDFGVQATFACVKPGRFPQSRRSQEATLLKVPMWSRFDLRPAWRLARLLRRERFDIVHTHTPRAALVGSLAARFARVPLVHHVHGQTVTEIGGGWRTRVSAATERLSLRRAAAVIAVSPTAAKYIEVWGVPAGRIHLVPNGVPAHRNPARRHHTPHEWTLGIVALLRPRKGLEVLLQAIALMRRRDLPVQLRVVGGFETDRYQRQVRALVDKLGIAGIVNWRGFRHDIDAELDSLDLLIFPSLLPEGMPMAVLEAMAAGVPTIASRVEGLTDLIRHGHDGLLCEQQNPQALADAVASVIHGRYDLQRLQEGAIQSHAEKYSDIRMAAGVADVYRAVIARGAGRQ